MKLGVGGKGKENDSNNIKVLHTCTGRGHNDIH
jgi:hypothetical protein